jgi:hypothetical protein
MNLALIVAAQTFFVPIVQPIAPFFEAGEAEIVRATTTDIGSPAGVVDANYDTLMRSASINPAEIVIEFDEPQTAEGFRVFVHSESSWKVEAADTVEDLDNQTGTYVDLTGLQRTTGEGLMGLEEPHTARVFRLESERLQGDDFVHIWEWEFVELLPVQSIELEVEAPSGPLQPGDVIQAKAFAMTDEGRIDVSEEVNWTTQNLRRTEEGWTPMDVVAGEEVQAALQASVGDVRGRQTFRVVSAN